MSGAADVSSGFDAASSRAGAPHEVLADGWEAAWSGHDTSAFASLCAPDLHYEDPVARTPLSGVAGLAHHAERLWRAFPDVTMESAGERVADGRRLVLPTRVQGTNTGSLDGLPASHRRLSVHVVFWCELEPAGVRLWRVRAFFDSHAAAVELGLIPRPGTLRSRAVLMLQGYGLWGGGG
jgi:steroid delta-isomerase-like uncharacterized protein